MEGKALQEGPDRVSLVLGEDEHHVTVWERPVNMWESSAYSATTILYSEEMQEARCKPKSYCCYRGLPMYEVHF